MAAAGWIVVAMALIGSAYTLAAAVLIGRYRAVPQPPSASDATPITVLKPLHGTEPRLRANLATVLAQDHGGPVQIVFGVRDAADPAIAIVEALRRDHPDADIAIVIAPQRHGTNNKLSNVINMAAHIRHRVVVLADSDVAWPPDTLRRLASALADPAVGIACCMHSGRGDAGLWSTLGAMDISYRFMPSVAVACATGLAEPCLGPTMALRRETLDAVGGFAAFADVLADDYELGRAVRARDLKIAIPAFTIVHSGDETTLAALARHELRWTRTIYGIDPLGFAGSIVTHTLPLALIGLMLTRFSAGAIAVVMLATLARSVTKSRVDRMTGYASGPLLLLPLRDILSFALFLATFFVNKVDWRGSRHRVTSDGRLRPDEATK